MSELAEEMRGSRVAGHEQGMQTGRQLDASVRRPFFGAAFLATQSLALNALGLFATAYIIRRLGALQYGEWAVAASMASAHMVVTNLGLRPLFVRDLARRPECAGELLAEQLALRMALGACAAASAMAICLLLGYPPVVIACMAVGCVWIMLSVLWSTLGDVLHSRERFGAYSMVALISGAVVTASSLVVVYMGFGPVGLSFAYLTTPAVNAWLYWREVRRQCPIRIRWDRHRALQLLSESRFIGFTAVASAIRDRAEQLLVPTVIGLEAFGIFSAGTLVPDRLGNVPDAVGTAFYPRVAHAAGRASPDAANAVVVTMLTIGIAVSIPLAVVGTYLAAVIGAILMPDARETCQSIIQITVWATPLLALSLGMSMSLQAAGHHDVAASAGLFAAAFSAMMSVALIATLGITGASWSFMARPGIHTLFLLPSFRASFPGALRSLPVGRIFLSTTTLVIVCVLTDRVRVWPSLGFASFGVAAYCLSLLASEVVTISNVMGLFTPTGSR